MRKTERRGCLWQTPFKLELSILEQQPGQADGCPALNILPLRDHTLFLTSTVDSLSRRWREGKRNDGLETHGVFIRYIESSRSSTLTMVRETFLLLFYVLRLINFPSTTRGFLLVSFLPDFWSLQTVGIKKMGSGRKHTYTHAHT